MVFTFLFEISDLWRHLAIFFIISKIKPNFPFISFSIKKWIILTIFSQNCNFFDVLHELIQSIWKEFWAKLPVCNSVSLNRACLLTILNTLSTYVIWLNGVTTLFPSIMWEFHCLQVKLVFFFLIQEWILSLLWSIMFLSSLNVVIFSSTQYKFYRCTKLWIKFQHIPV